MNPFGVNECTDRRVMSRSTLLLSRRGFGVSNQGGIAELSCPAGAFLRELAPNIRKVAPVVITTFSSRDLLTRTW
jgi:hypothetical protein